MSELSKFIGETSYLTVSIFGTDKVIYQENIDSCEDEDDNEYKNRVAERLSEARAFFACHHPKVEVSIS